MLQLPSTEYMDILSELRKLLLKDKIETSRNSNGENRDNIMENSVFHFIINQHIPSKTLPTLQLLIHAYLAPKIMGLLKLIL
jgi:hypothetical protein